MGRTVEIILGPTGVGKTDFSIDRALEVSSPVISCDSRQIYKEMRIGTAVPSDEQLERVQHYFIQTVSVNTPYTAGDYEREALDLVDRLFAEGHETLIMTGGSMLYVEAFCSGLDDIPDVPLSLREHLMDCLETEGVDVLASELKELDPATYESIDLSNGRRVVRALEVCLYTGQPFSSFKTGKSKVREFDIVKKGLSRDREDLYSRIDGRVLKMMDEGLEKEARNLLHYRDLPALKTVGYREMFDYFDGVTDLDTAVSLIQRNSRHYAKRQLTWWRKDPEINWINL